MAENQEEGRWLPSDDAAKALGVSERTLRRHLQADRYAMRRESNRLYVFVSHDDGSRSATASERKADGLGASVETAEPHVRRLEARLAEQAERLERIEASLLAHNRRLERLDWLTERLLNRTETIRRWAAGWSGRSVRSASAAGAALAAPAAEPVARL